MRKIFLILCLTLIVGSAAAQDGGIAMSPGRFELEMDPGTDTTVVINVDYRPGADPTKPARIVASLNDWTITKDAQIAYFPANTRPDSASSWLTYTPAEAPVYPGTVHQIRVTVSVPANAAPGDHL